MTRTLSAVAAVLGILFSGAHVGQQDYGSPPRLLIASGIDPAGNLILSNTEQRQKKVTREVEKDGMKTTHEGSMTGPVTFLNRQTVSLKDATIYDHEGNKISIDQARDRLKEPTPILLTIAGEKVHPIYRKIMTKDTLTFTFSWFPEFKEIPDADRAKRIADEAKRKGVITVGDKVPDFSVRTLAGKTVTLGELLKDEKRTKKGIVVLTFWCSTCSSCRLVEHQLDKLAKDYEGQAAVIGLDVNAGETPEKVTAFAKEKGLTLPIVLDPGGRTADMFGVEVTTTTVVIDGAGVLRYCGRFRDDRVAYAEAAVKALLAGKEVAVKTTSHEG